MAEYVVKLRVVTEAAPREVVDWDAMALVAARLFKAQRPVVPIALVSVLVEQVPASKLGDHEAD